MDGHPTQTRRFVGLGHRAPGLYVSGIFDDHDVLEGGDLTDDRRDPGEQTGGDDEDARPGVGELV